MISKTANQEEENFCGPEIHDMQITPSDIDDFARPFLYDVGKNMSHTQLPLEVLVWDCFCLKSGVKSSIWELAWIRLVRTRSWLAPPAPSAQSLRRNPHSARHRHH